MNFQVDIIIVGDSKTGHDVLDTLASSKPKANIAFVSQAFKKTTTPDYRNVDYFRQEVVYVSYRHRLFRCFLKNGDVIYSTHFIVASGLNYEPLMINNESVPCVFNNIDDVPANAKDQQALVICNQNSDARFALEVATKYKQVYLCIKELNLNKCATVATAKKITEAENIVVLPNTCIKQVITDTANILQKVVLDNYSEVDCSAIYAKTAAKPALEFIPRKLLVQEEGYPVVTENCESTLVAKCFMVGNCLKKYTKGMEQKIINTILKDF
jgi:thioredoxin reductase